MSGEAGGMLGSGSPSRHQVRSLLPASEPGLSGSAAFRLVSTRGSQRAQRRGWVWGRRVAEGQHEEPACPPGGQGGAAEGLQLGQGGGPELESPRSS